jgi:hypothetical protein
MGINFPYKLIKISIDLVISAESCDTTSKDSISDYLNQMLYTDPEFFGDFGPENIVEVNELT